MGNLHRATEGDLSAHGRYLLERAYRARVRTKTSRDDFADGYIAGLIDARNWSAFATAPVLLLAPGDTGDGPSVDPVAVHRSTR